MKQTPTGIAVRAAAAGLALVSLAACGSSNSSTAPKTSPSAGTSPLPASSVLTPAATAQIKTAYTTFFGIKNPALIPTVLQNADKLTAVIAAQSKNPISAGLSATVSKVALVNPHLADVTFNLLNKGQMLAPNQVGKAVLVDGTWKVAAYTFCGLASVAGPVPAECQVASTVALPTS